MVTPLGAGTVQNQVPAWDGTNLDWVAGLIGISTGSVLYALASGAIGAEATLAISRGGTNQSAFTLGYLPYFDNTRLVNSPVFTDGANVGIGTASPWTNLDVLGKVNIGNQLSFADPSTYLQMGVSAGTSISFTIWQGGTAAIAFGCLANDSNVYIANLYNGVFGTAAYLMSITPAGKVGIGTKSPVSPLTVAGPIALQAPNTQTGSTYSQVATDWSIIINYAGTHTITLLAASSYSGQTLLIKTITAHTVVSASSDVVPLAGGSADTAILAATAGKWALLQSDGSNWVIMAGN